MLMPKRTKYRKMMRGRMTGKAYRGVEISFGEFGLQATEPAWVSSRQIEAARRAVTNYLKRGGKVWIRIFPGQAGDAEAGRDPHGVRQGQPGVLGCRRQAGPGHVRGGWRARRAQAEEALRRAAMKMPMDCRFIERQHIGVATTADEEESGVPEEVVA